MLGKSADEVFAGAGTGPGVQAWRIEKKGEFIEPVANAEALAGHLHTGDSYLLLKTVAQSGGFAYSLFFWEGASSGLERGAAAELAVELDKFLKGKAPPVREEQASESAGFLALFNGKALVYDATGGHSGGFHHVEAGSSHKYGSAVRLLQVTAGKHGAAAVVGPVDASAPLNPAFCYVLDSSSAPYVWVGGSSHPADRFAAVEEAGKACESAGRGAHEIVTLNDGDALPPGFTAALAAATGAHAS